MTLSYMGVPGRCQHGEYTDKPCDKCEIEQLRQEIAKLRAQHVHCDHCGGTWLDDGINTRRYCDVSLQSPGPGR